MSASMTGYGRGEAAGAERRLIVEIKSVNNRYCDIQIRMPRLFAALENRVREMVASRVARGKLDLYITYEDRSAQASQVRYDAGLVHAYALALREMASRENMPDGLNAGLIARFNDVLQVEPGVVPMDEVQALLEHALNQALDGLCKMRALEGARMADDIRERAQRLETMRQGVAARAPQVVTAYRQRLTDRVQELFGDQASSLVSEERLAVEIAMYADKCAIDEELVRLQSHLKQLQEGIGLDEPVGKKLDFLVQEINREINTIGSKANDLNLVQDVVTMKSEVEKIREQVQNLE
ncbi:MAG: YicC family protein [Clostridiaceae bacterium]|nr:YicC family protein [Clostridiales bacterium]NLB43707.1 YicC family protein [Clostridiaceae bacterium]